MAIEDNTIILSSVGGTAGAPPTWDVASDASYTWSSGTHPSFEFSNGAGCTLYVVVVGPNLYALSVSDSYSVGWTALGNITYAQLVAGGTVIGYVSGGAVQAVDHYMTEPPPPPPIQTNVPRALILSRMPTEQKKLVQYGLAIANVTGDPTVLAAAQAYQQTIQQLAEPSGRTAVIIQQAKDQEATLKKEIRKKVAPVAAKDKVRKPIILSGDAPSFSIETAPGTVTIRSLKGAPKNAVEKWFEVQIVDSIVNDGGEGLEEAITRTGTKIQTAGLNFKKAYVRGRWAWKVNGTITFGPYTGWTEINLTRVDTE